MTKISARNVASSVHIVRIVPVSAIIARKVSVLMVRKIVNALHHVFLELIQVMMSCNAGTENVH